MAAPKSNLPRHVGIIMDGNRRWARAKGLKTFEGHLRGYENLRTLSRYIIEEKGVAYLSVFAFSTENWQRTQAEVGYLMKLLVKAFGEYLEDFKKNDGRIVVLGSRQRLSPAVLKAVERAEAETEHGSAGTLAICFNYGGQAEIVDAAQRLLEGPPAEPLSPEAFAEYLYHPDVPPVDLLIRTSGEQRTSGFMLWRAAYAELYFSDKHWPAFTKTDVDAALTEYAARQRRFGA